MHIPLTILVVFILVSLVTVALADWFALQIFGLRTTKANLAKIIIIDLVATAVIGFAGTAQGVLSLFLLIVYAAIWNALIHHYIADRYSVGRAVGSYITSYLLIFGFSLVAATVMITSIMQTFNIDGESMSPTLHNNDKVLVYKFEKQPSDNIVIVYKLDTGKGVLGRVHGTPGQSVAISSSQVVVSGKTESLKTYTLGSNQYYVTVDNASYNIPARVIDGSSIVGTIGPKL